MDNFGDYHRGSITISGDWGHYHWGNQSFFEIQIIDRGPMIER